MEPAAWGEAGRSRIGQDHIGCPGGIRLGLGVQAQGDGAEFIRHCQRAAVARFNHGDITPAETKDFNSTQPGQPGDDSSEASPGNLGAMGVRSGTIVGRLEVSIDERDVAVEESS